jgi:hypothetical protein
MTSWQKRLVDQNVCLEKVNDRLKLQLDEQNKRLVILEKLAYGPPTIMMACEHIVQAAAHQVSDMLQFVKETKR